MSESPEWCEWAKSEMDRLTGEWIKAKDNANTLASALRPIVAQDWAPHSPIWPLIARAIAALRDTESTPDTKE